MKVLFLLTILISHAHANYVATQISQARELALVCQSPNYETFNDGMAVRMDLPIVETGINTIGLGMEEYGRVLFTFQSREGWSNQTYTISFDSFHFINRVLSYKLSGDRKVDYYGNSDKLYEIYTLDESLEVYRDGSNQLDIIEMVPYRSINAQFKMMLDGEIFEKYAGDYLVNCFIGTSL